jgi:hypothetical protein
MSRKFYGNRPHRDRTRDLANILQRNDPHRDRDCGFNTGRYSKVDVAPPWAPVFDTESLKVLERD